MKTEEIKKEIGECYKKHEKLDDKLSCSFDKVAESIGDLDLKLDTKIDALDKKIDAVEERITNNIVATRSIVSGLATEVKGIAKSVESTEVKVTKIFEKIEEKLK